MTDDLQARRTYVRSTKSELGGAATAEAAALHSTNTQLQEQLVTVEAELIEQVPAH